MFHFITSSMQNSEKLDSQKIISCQNPRYWTKKIKIGDLNHSIIHLKHFFFKKVKGIFYSDIFTIYNWVLRDKTYIEITF